MFDDLKNLNIDTCSDSELIALIRQTIPTVITFFKASQKILNENKSNQSPCDNCDKAKTCEEPCELLEAKLPGVYSGSYILNKTCGDLMDEISDIGMDNSDDDDIPKELDHSSLKIIDRTRTHEIFCLYKNCNPIFTAKEWRIVTLKLRDGNSYKSIGKKLGISVSTACDTFQRAKRKMENYYSRQKFIRFEKRNFT